MYGNQSGRISRRTTTGNKHKDEANNKKVVIHNLIKNEDPKQSIYYNCSETGIDIKYVGSNHNPRRICDFCRKQDFPPIQINGFTIDHLGVIVKMVKEGDTLHLWIDGMAHSLSCGIAMDEIEYSTNNAISAGSKYPDPYATLCTYLGCEKPKKSPPPRLAPWNGGSLTEEEYDKGLIVYRPAHIKLITVSDCRQYYVAIV